MIAAILVILIVLGVGGGLAGNYYAKISRDSGVLLQELDALLAAENEFIDDPQQNRTALEEILNRSVCGTEPCQKMESGTKSYIRDLLVCLDDYTQLSEDERLGTIFLPENIASDGPEFEESIAYLESMRTKFESVHQRFADLLTVDMLKSYMHLNDLDPITRAVAGDEIEGLFNESTLSEWTELAQQDDAFIDECIAALELLQDEPENWAVRGGYVEIYDDDLYEAYSAALNALTLEQKTAAA